MTKITFENLKPKRDLIWHWISRDGDTSWQLRDPLRNVGILKDGSLYNPHNYPEEVVRTAVTRAIEREHERRRRNAKKAAETRARRHKLRIDAVALKVKTQAKVGPRSHCACCEKKLDDPASIELGIGPECWQHILQRIEYWKLNPAENIS